MTAVVVLTTVGSSFDAQGLARQLVGERVAACVNIIDGVTSIYRWKDAVEVDGEKILIIKTTRDRLDDLRDNLFARHPYEVPEFVVLPIERIDGPYQQWLLDSVGC